MIVVVGLVVMVVLGAVGSWHLRPSKHPRSIHYRNPKARHWE